MNVLLLLSALLSALTGVSGGAQRVAVRSEQMAAASLGVAAHVVAAPRDVVRFVETFDPTAAMQVVVPLVRLPVGASALYAGRLRE